MTTASTLTDTLQDFISKQVELGNAKSESEVRAGITKSLDEMETKRRVEIGRQQVREEKTKPLNDEFVKNLKSKIKAKIVNPQSE